MAQDLEATYAVIAKVLYKYTFTHPVEFQDCDVVRTDLLQALPGYTAEVFHKHRNVAVRIWAPDGVRIYDQHLNVTGYPK